MKLSSKELTIILIELLVGILLWILSSRIGFSFNTKLSSIIGLILLIIVVIIILVLVFGIIYRRFGELDRALEKQENKELELEEKLKRVEQLIDIKTDIKDLQR